MTKEELCTILTGREYTKEINSRIIGRIHGTGLVIVFGASDDLMKFRGAIYNEVGCSNGGKAYLNSNGLLENRCSADDCPYFADQKKRAMTIEALWCAEPGISWTYKTDIPHSTFIIVPAIQIRKDGEVYCRGIVFNLADVKERE